MLWQTLQGIKSGKVHPEEAHAVARQSREIIRVVKAELEVQHAVKEHGGNAAQRLGFGNVGRKSLTRLGS